MKYLEKEKKMKKKKICQKGNTMQWIPIRVCFRFWETNSLVCGTYGLVKQLWSSVGHQSIKSINKEITRPDDQNRIDLLPAEAAGASGFLLGINQRPKGYFVFHGRPSCVCLCLTYHIWLAYFSSVKILVGIPHRPRTLFSHGLEWWAGWILLQNTGP